MSENSTRPEMTPSLVHSPSDSVAHFVRILDYYLLPVVICTGLIGNTLSFMVFVFTSLKTLSSSVYLAALSISDSGFLICVLFSWLINVDVQIYHEPGWCETFVYLTYVFSFLSVWYVVAFTIERWIVVLFPFKRGDMCTVKKANIVVTSLAIFGFLAYNFGIWTAKSLAIRSTNDTEAIPFCTITEKFRHFVHIMNNVDTVVTLILPMCVITVLNVQIVRAVTRLNQDRGEVFFNSGHSRQQTTLNNRKKNNQTGFEEASAKQNDSPRKILTKTTSSGSEPTPKSPRLLAFNSGQNRVTKMLLVVSTIFLLLNLPPHSLRIYFFIMSLVNTSYEPPHIILSLQKLFTYLYYVNFSINFFLYSLCGNNFRKALRNLLCTKNRPWSGRQSFSSVRGHEGGTREEMLVRRRQVDSVVSFNDGKTCVSAL